MYKEPIPLLVCSAKDYTTFETEIMRSHMNSEHRVNMVCRLCFYKGSKKYEIEKHLLTNHVDAGPQQGNNKSSWVTPVGKPAGIDPLILLQERENR